MEPASKHGSPENADGVPREPAKARPPSSVVVDETLGLAPVEREARRLNRFSGRQRGPRRPPLLSDEAFRLFWFSRLLTQIGQGALVYAFLLISADRTDSAIVNSLYVVCAIVPAIMFGLPAGVLVDLVARRPLMIGLNIARFAFAFGLLIGDPSLIGIFAATLGLWTIHQFYAPSESATLAALVERDRYPAAQALANLALTIAQVIGLVILAPVMLKTFGPRVLFALCATLFFVAGGLVGMLPRIDDHLAVARSSKTNRSPRVVLLTGWHGARADLVTFQALVSDVLIGIGMSALVVIMPLYLKRVLDTSADNTVFVFAPAALGLVAGLRLAPFIGRSLGEQNLATGSLIGFAACVGALGFVERLRDFLVNDVRLPLYEIADVLGIPSLVTVAILLSIPAGFCSAMVGVTARSLLLARTPPSRRGQTIATTALLGNIGALAPTLLAGVAADLVGVERVAVAIAVTLAVGSLAVRTVARPLPAPSTVPSA